MILMNDNQGENIFYLIIQRAGKIIQEIMCENLKYIYIFSETPYIMWKVSLNPILWHFYEQKSLFKTHPCVQIYFSLTRPKKEKRAKASHIEARKLFTAKQ